MRTPSKYNPKAPPEKLRRPRRGEFIGSGPTAPQAKFLDRLLAGCHDCDTFEEAIAACAAAGRELHPSTNPAFLTRAVDAGRSTLETLSVTEASRLIKCLKRAAWHCEGSLAAHLADYTRRERES